MQAGFNFDHSAPEILLRKGYTYGVDWWSLGVMVFELAFGRRPFHGRKSGDLTHSICHGTLKFPHDAENKFSVDGLVALREVSCFSFLRLFSIQASFCCLRILSSWSVIQNIVLAVVSIDLVSSTRSRN